MLRACIRRHSWAAIALSNAAVVFGISLAEDGYHVRPGENIQDAINLAADNLTNKVVKVHAGVYRPVAMRQAMIWFNRKHDGVKVIAMGDVTLTAANPKLSRPSSRSFPAVVNHVVYFGDGISSNTLLKGFRITGANGYVTDKLLKLIEPDESIPKNMFFFTDGGGIKVFGRSYPTIEDVEVVDNFTSPCGAGVSVQHQGHNGRWVIFRNCVFRKNRTQVTGAAVDLLEGSAAKLINCLFVGNVSNTGVDVVAQRSGEAPFKNNGVVTIFYNSKALVQSCTFTGNRNGVDDMAGQSEFYDSIFYKNDRDGGMVPAERFELDLAKGGKVERCFINGEILDPVGAVDSFKNKMNCPDPMFNDQYEPTNPEFRQAGYRRVKD